MTNPKCEACGGIGGDKCVIVHTPNGCLSLCPMCLANINGKNPELIALRTEHANLKERAERLRFALVSIRQWDLLNPPNPLFCAGFPWLREVVDNALREEA